MRNRLRNETSPYLKQHEENPVDWYPWGQEALEKAKRENKPILLSVGYSACHWCHVMAHESFENPEIAELMNANYVNIKVDREERPDLDHIYQNVAQAMTQGGGWPLTVFLLPDQRPFFGGTYFPPEDKWGRPGFPRVLQSLAEAYRNDFHSVQENARRLSEIIGELEQNSRSVQLGSGADAGAEKFPFLKSIAEEMLSHLDWNHGGFGSAPKFPNTMMLSFLWRLGNDPRADSDFRERATAGVILTLAKMAKGGIFDQIGGGFSRYSVDERWAVPHFEKMLYDNGLLLQIYSEVLSTDRARKNISAESRALFIETIEKTVLYLLREMEDDAGGFYAAQDADSEGEEGKFFVWDPKELETILTPEEARAFARRYGVDEMGNFEHGKTVLFQDMEIAEVASRAGMREGDARIALAKAEKKVFAAREKRIRPGLDDKLLSGWNGLMISGLLWASHALGKHSDAGTRAKRAAERAFRRFAELSRNGAALPASIQKGVAKGNAYLDDYAFLARAALDLYRFTAFESPARADEILAAAEGWIDRIFTHFSDPSGDPGFFFTSDDHEALLQRPKTLYDQAIPSGTSVALTSAIVGAEIAGHLLETGHVKFESHAKAARQKLERLEPALASNPFGYGELASAVLVAESGLRVFGGADAVAAIIGDRDFAMKSKVFGDGEPERFQVCEKGICQEYSSRDEWAARA